MNETARIIVAAIVVAFVAYYWRPGAVVAVLILFILLANALQRSGR